MVNTENLSDKDHVSKFLLEKSHALKWKIEKCERFSTGETGKKKQSMNYSYHKELLKQNIDIIYNCKVEKIISNNGVAEYLEAFDKNKKKN